MQTVPGMVCAQTDPARLHSLSEPVPDAPNQSAGGRFDNQLLRLAFRLHISADGTASSNVV